MTTDNMMKRQIKTRLDRRLGLAVLTMIVLLTACSRRSTPSLTPTAEAAPLDPLKEAIRLVEEDRGEAMGRKAEVEIPSELRHYSDRRKFLAVQTAAWQETRYTLPHDFAQLIDLIERGELVEAPPVAPEYVLYGVGDAATDEPFTHYDAASKQSIPLCYTDEDFNREDEQLAGSIAEMQTRVAALTKELKTIGRRDRNRRKAVSAQIGATRASIATAVKRQKVLESFSKDPDRRALLRTECNAIKRAATSFRDRSYNLDDPASRKMFKIRLLSFIRRDALEVMLEIARAYKQKFSRPLAVTSLVRTEEYQHLISEWNRNAARNSSPPHATGLAFDVYYKFMSSAEQDFLMSLIAEMKDAGRIEALRETRDHIHVFAFSAGRPQEKAVAQVIATSPSPKIKPRHGKRAH
jgi:uncharacterized protein DUF5715